MLQVRCAHPTGVFAPKRLFKPFRCYGRLIFRKEYTVLFAPKRSTSRFAALTLRVTSHRNDPSSRSGVPHGLFSFRTDPPSVRRCSARLIRQAETLELQPHSRPPSKRTALSVGKRSCFGSLRSPCAFAPKRLFRPFRCYGRLIFRKEYTVLFAPENARPSGSLRSPCGDRGADLRVLMPPLCKGRCRTDEGRLTEGFPLSRIPPERREARAQRLPAGVRTSPRKGAGCALLHPNP